MLLLLLLISKRDALTLTHVVDRIRSALQESAPSAVEAYDSKLFASGYRPEDDYSDYWWDLGDLLPFEVTGDFPRIEASALPDGVEKVTYNVTLSDCVAFQMDLQGLLHELESTDAA